MTYVIDVFFQGNKIKSVIESGEQSIDAINKVDSRFKAKSVSLSDKSGNNKSYNWTGYEFQARRI